MYEAPALFIAGEEVRPRDTPAVHVINPATEERLGSCPSAGPDEVQRALAAAERGLEAWRKVSPWERSGLLRKTAALLRERASAIGTTMTLEVGKTLAESKNEVKVAADTLEWCADEARRIYDLALPGRTPGSHFEICHEPVGVTLALTPWNAPISLGSRKLAMSLAAGCSSILRPAEEAPACVAALVKCFHDAGVPAGVVNLLFGSPESVIAPLMAAPTVRMVSFTGSVRIGQRLIRDSAETLKRLTLELGGHAPVFVLADAPIDSVATALADRKTKNAGQVCTAPSRIFVEAPAAKRFTEKFTDSMAAITVGNGMNPAFQMGPLTTQRQLERTERLVEDARRKGAHVATGGKRAGNPGHGYFYRPTVLTDVPTDAHVMQEEPFCPVAVVIPFTDLDQALEMANGVEAALAAYVFTQPGARADHIMRNVQAGVVALNSFQSATAEAPFGGVKAGGYGREGGIAGVHEYLITKFKHRTGA